VAANRGAEDRFINLLFEAKDGDIDLLDGKAMPPRTPALIAARR
jgi:hypothetical protein